MRSVLEEANVGAGGRFDLARGALDAWLHPPRPSRLPALLAMSGGGIWTLVALTIVTQPVLPDWPGYIQESIGLAIVGVVLLTGAVVGAWLRLGEGTGSVGVVAVDIAVAGHVAWAVALVVALIGLEYGASTALAQAAAAVGTILVGLVALRSGRGWLGLALVAAGTGLVVPSAWGWLLAGGAWIVVGIVELRDRPEPAGPRPVGA
jgi:hypothetical protein